MIAQLEIRDLSLTFRTRHGVVRALEDVSLSVERGEIVGVVGESGSGKSVMAYTVMGLNDAAAKVQKGSITVGGTDMLSSSADVLRGVRGREIAMIFQSPRTALNPIRRVGRQIEDVLLSSTRPSRAAISRRRRSQRSQGSDSDPERRYAAYPFELSGGMCQRVMIAIALACSPSVLIADEPTTGLDVTTQAVIMDLIREMNRESRMSTLLITHDLGLAGEYCDRIASCMPATSSRLPPPPICWRIPRIPIRGGCSRRRRRHTSSLRPRRNPGNLPDLRAELPPCRFSARCERKQPACDVAPLPWTALSPTHLVRCQVPL